MKQPCRGCKERYDACWDTCPKYREWRAEVDDENKRKDQYYAQYQWTDSKRRMMREYMVEKKKWKKVYSD